MISFIVSDRARNIKLSPGSQSTLAFWNMGNTRAGAEIIARARRNAQKVPAIAGKHNFRQVNANNFDL